MADIDPVASTQRAVPASLEYPAASRAVTVRGIRLLVFLTLVNTTLLSMSVLGPQLFPFIRMQLQQWQVRRAEEKATKAARAIAQQCLTYAPLVDKVVYEEEPGEVLKLLKEQGGAYHSPARRHATAPPGWVAPISAVAPPFFSSSRDQALLFLHERTSPGGARHLVWVQLYVEHDYSRETRVTNSNPPGTSTIFHAKKRRLLAAAAKPVRPDGLTEPKPAHQRTAELVLPDKDRREMAQFDREPSFDKPPPIDYGNVLRVFAGQPDPTDASHFTIPYRVDGRDGVIDGWLKDDGLHLRPREGQWSYSDSGDGWRLPTGPPTEPFTGPSEAPEP